MATPEFNAQFLRNQETIAAFAGLQPLEPFEERNGLCEECGEEATAQRLRVNAGICDNCATCAYDSIGDDCKCQKCIEGKADAYDRAYDQHQEGD